MIGPVLTGLYWMRKRPQSPFGPMLIGWGVVGALYILQSSSDSWLFSIGLFWEKVFGLGTYVLILAFPTGRLDRPSKIVLAAGVVTVLLLAVAIQLLLPQVGAGGSISSCRSLCPHNELAFTSDPALALDLFEVFSYAVLALALTVAGMVVHRFITGTPPRRRALAIGTPVALLFLLCEILYQLLTIVGAEDSELYGVVIWVFVAARASVWYGFLFALIAAELFAARAMGRLVEQSLDHPSKQELEVMLREPLGDPQLRLEFLADRATDPDAERQAVEAGPGRDVTVVQRDGSPAVAIVHDAQLDDDPELLNAAGAIALLAAENAELDAGWKETMRDLERSRTRLVRAADEERRKFERNLHDGAQQQLIAIKIWLELAADATVDGATRDRLVDIADNAEGALEEIRAVSHGLYPQLLSDSGLVAALQSIQRRTPVPLRLRRRRRRALLAGGRVGGLLLLSGGDPECHQARRPQPAHLRDAAPGRGRVPVRRRGRRRRLRGRAGHRDRPPEHARPPRRCRRPPHRAYRSRPGHARVRARAAVRSPQPLKRRPARTASSSARSPGTVMR